MTTAKIKPNRSRIFLINGTDKLQGTLPEGAIFISESDNKRGYSELPGWYFSDECEMLMGPYDTYDVCLKMCNEYEP